MAQGVDNAVYGLQGMSSECPEVREMLSVLSWKVRDSTEKLSAQAVGNALYGLQGMSSECPEVKEMLSVLSWKVRDEAKPPQAG